MDKKRTWTQQKTLDKLNKLPENQRKKQEIVLKRKNYLLYCRRKGIIPDPDMYKNKYTKIKPTDSFEEKKEKCLYNIEYYKAILESLDCNNSDELSNNSDCESGEDN